jgi:hypothetical protein
MKTSAIITVLLLFLVYFSKAQLFLQSSYFNNNCNVNDPHYGMAVCFIIFHILQTDAEKCISFGSFSQIISKVNETTFHAKSYCETNCQNCQQDQNLPLSCYKSPGVVFSAKTSFGVIPEIKTNGFNSRVYLDPNCEKNQIFQSFVTDRVCGNIPTDKRLFYRMKLLKGYESIFLQYNTVLKQAEEIGFSGKGCTGEIVTKQIIPLGKCTRVEQFYVKIEKP